MDTLRHFEGCLLGLALGEALVGLALGGDVPIVQEETLDMLDGAQLAIGVACALTGKPDLPLSARQLGAAFADALAELDDDPRFLDRAASHSAIVSIDHLARGVPWDRSGNPESDGFSPTLRVAPVGMAYPPGFAAVPAAVQAYTTHKTPTAASAAIIAAELISRLVRGAPLNVAVVKSLLQLPGELDRDGMVGDAVHAALRGVAERRQPDVGVVPPFDGGYRSASGLGLAVWIALRHASASPRPGSFSVALADAARLDGNRRGVAGLVGAFLGAAWGFGALPATAVERLERHHELIDIGRALHLRARGLAGALGRPELGSHEPGWSTTPPGAQSRRFSRSGHLVRDVVAQSEASVEANALQDVGEPVIEWVKEGAVDPEAQLAAWVRR